MKKLIAFSILLALSKYTYAIDYKKSVFKIQPINSNKTGTAFLSQGKGIVTALHVVLPSGPIRKVSDVRIKFISPRCNKEAVLQAIDIANDLATFSNPGCPNTSPLRLKNYQANSSDLVMWGYPLTQRNLLASRMKVRINGNDTVASYLGNIHDYQGPAPATEIINLENDMFSGHSGAPLLAGNTVVAIANGGIPNSSITWAIPWSSKINLKQPDINQLNAHIRKRIVNAVHSYSTNPEEIAVLEFTNNYRKNIKFTSSHKRRIDLGRINAPIRSIKKLNSNELIDFNLNPNAKSFSPHDFSKNSKYELNFVRNGQNNFLEIIPPRYQPVADQPTDQNFIRDKKNRLLWSREVKTLNWSEARNYVTQARRSRLGGYNDWRLPSREELSTLYELSMSEPGLVNQNESWFWSSTKAEGIKRMVIVNGGRVTGTRDKYRQERINIVNAVRLVRSY